MSFNITYYPDGISEQCDKCSVIDEQPYFYISQKSRGVAANAIFIHERCLADRTESAKRLYVKRNKAECNGKGVRP